MSDLSQHNERIAGLVFKYLLRQLSDAERIELDEWIAASETNQVQFDEMTRRPALRSKLHSYNQVDTGKIWQKIADQVPAVDAAPVTGIPRRGRVLWFRIAIAAAIIGIIVFAGWQYFIPRSQKEAATPIVTTNDVAPGGNKAILTLSDGKKVILDEAKQGTVAKQGKTVINKTREGELKYNANAALLTIDHSPLTYNTITTPRGGQYHVVLPDGSHVWLNAASSIHFPTQFTGKEREVSVRGEAYFEVEKNKAKPFKVVIAADADNKENWAAIEVTGTHFNVNAYEDEGHINTTLLEGSIKFTVDPKTQNGGHRTPNSKQLSPGQQAILNKKAEKVSVINNEEAEAAISWVKGVFHFEKADLGNVMRQLSRWYDVQIKYEGNLPQQTITGDVERNIPLSELLAVLEKMGKARFSVQGRTVRVIP